MHLNDLVEVELTSYGLSLWTSYGGREMLVENKLRITLWRLMYVFGDFIYEPNPDIFVNNEVKTKLYRSIGE